MTAASTAGLPNPQFGLIAGGQGGAQQPSGLTIPSGTHTDLAGTAGVYVSSDGGKPTYRASAFAQTWYSTAAAVIVEIQGSATKTIRVKQILLWLAGNTGKFYSDLTLIRAGGLSASGTPTAATIGKHDTFDPTATAVINYYTAAATVGTGNATIGGTVMYGGVSTATFIGAPPAGWNFTRSQDKALILRGTTDVIQVFNNTLTFTGSPVYGFEVEWEEDNS